MQHLMAEESFLPDPGKPGHTDMLRLLRHYEGLGFVEEALGIWSLTGLGRKHVVPGFVLGK
eukprot:14722459-Heterocapsa_arctica.AAC.1